MSDSVEEEKEMSEKKGMIALDEPPRRDVLAALLVERVRLALAKAAADTAWACDEDRAVQGLHGAARDAHLETVRRVHLIHDRAVEEKKAKKIAEAFAHTLFEKKRKTAKWRLGFIKMSGGGPGRYGRPWYAKIVARRRSVRVGDFDIKITYE